MSAFLRNALASQSVQVINEIWEYSRRVDDLDTRVEDDEGRYDSECERDAPDSVAQVRELVRTGSSVCSDDDQDDQSSENETWIDDEYSILRF